LGKQAKTIIAAKNVNLRVAFQIGQQLTFALQEVTTIGLNIRQLGKVRKFLIENMV